MAKITIVIMFLGLLIFFSHLLSKMFDKTKIPNVLILMLIGIAAGFFVDDTIFFGQVGRVFTTVTLIIILFESGIELKIKELRSSILSATLMAFVNFVLTVSVIAGISIWLLNFDFTSALFLGGILGAPTSAVVIPLVKQMKLSQKASTVLLLESAFSSVLCLVVGLAALDSMQAGNLRPAAMLGNMLTSFVFAFLLGLIGGFVWSVLLNKVRALKNSMFTTLAFLFIIYGGVDLLGFNGGIAALTFGVVLGNSEYFNGLRLKKKIIKSETAKLKDSEKNFFSEIVFILQTYFFVYVGIIIEFGSLYIYLLALAIVCLLILTRMPTTRLLVGRSCSTHERLVMSIMMPKGLIAAVLASIPLQNGLPYGQEIAECAYAIVLTSIIACSIMVIIVNFRTNKSTNNESNTNNNIQE